MPNGPEQEARDKLFLSRLGHEDDTNEPFPSRWLVLSPGDELHCPFSSCRLTFDRTCPVVQPWLYGYDADNEVDNAVKQNPDFSIERPNL